MKHKGLLFEIVTMKHKELLSKIVTMPEIRLRIIFFLLVFLILGKLILNCRTNLGKKMVMTNDIGADVAQLECSNLKY